MSNWERSADGKETVRERGRVVLSREQVIERLQWLRDAKAGDILPPWLAPNVWGASITELADCALQLIAVQGPLRRRCYEHIAQGNACVYNNGSFGYCICDFHYNHRDQTLDQYLAESGQTCIVVGVK